ncbi:hypothetical protein CYMTET_16466 [Cymbomonas tetramitiformis]|uniref:GST C-terminal domain-containing protein n=1 Tax=Cymbomonas tetramitiformis TaxID=36881 RepID=A0AAE0L847_9CHLO|nr:hypothetical protein CYMTET_16466 [Cymbomonas tetramitiformis]
MGLLAGANHSRGPRNDSVQGDMPLLGQDGFVLYPECPLLAFAVDEFIDVFEDIRMKVQPTMQIPDQQEKEEARAGMFGVSGECTELLMKIEAECGEEHMIGDRVTLCDLWAFYFLNLLRCSVFEGVPRDYLLAYPKLAQNVTTFGSLPAVREYYSERAEQNPMYALFVTAAPASD